MSEEAREEKQEKEESKEKQNFSIPLAIIVAGFVIAIALVFTKNNVETGLKPVSTEEPETEETEKIDIKIGKDAHILGDPNASITLVEFSDIDCPYCRNFHPTMLQIINDYPEVRWVYKHFPLDNLHPNARKKAEATECAAQIGGNQAFWQTLDKLVQDQEPSSDCLDAEKAKDKVNSDYLEGISAGAQGTPYSILIGPDGSTEVIGGAISYSALSAMIDNLLE